MTAAGFDVRYTPAEGQPRTLLFVPTEDAWLRAEFEWTDGEWRPVGCEDVHSVALFAEDHPTGAVAREQFEEPPTDIDSESEADDE